MSAFDVDRQPVDQARVFQVVPRAAGGWPAVEAALVRLLERCRKVGGWWWATIDLGDEARTAAYAHLGPDEGELVWTEVSSDFYLPEDEVLTAEQEAALVARGWSEPLDEVGMENFHRRFGGDELAVACAEVLSTLRAVYGFRDDEELRVVIDPMVVTGSP